MHRVFTISLFFFVTTFSLAQTYDESFKPVITANATILAIARQSDGKVLVAGNFTYNGAASIGNLIRINTDGTLDATFKKVVTDAFVFDIKVQADGKILIGGAFQKVNTTTRLGLARLNSDGTVDDAFNAVPGFANTSNNIPWVNGIGIQSDNKIVIQGYFEFVNNSSHRYIARLNADGSTDEAFQTALTSSGGSHELYPVVIQTDGKILIAGRFTKVNDVAANRLARLNTDGSLDTGFGNNIGTGPNNTIRSMALQSDGKILIGGIFNQFNGSAINQVARLNSNGTLDSGFPANIGFNSGNFVTSVFVQPDQKIVVGGNFQDPKPRILRLNTNGTMDANFDPGTGFTANGATSVYAIELMGSQYLFGGDFIQYNNNIRPGLARVNSNGTIDNTFDLKLGTTGGVFAAAVQSNGKIIIGGNFLYVNGTLSPRLARLNTNGTLDTFTAGTGFSNTVRAVHVLADGKVIVGGIFTHYNGTSISRLVRLNSNGTLDNTFSVTFTTSFTSSGVYGIKPAPGNKLLIFGGFSSVNSNATKNVALLNLDGTSASTFVGDNLTSSWITDADIRSDGYIIATSNVNEGEVRLLNSNGTIRTSFGLQGKLNSNPATAIFDTDGNIVFGGYQISYSGSSFRKIFKTDFTANLLPFNYQLIDQNVRVNKIVKHNNKYFVGKTFLAQPQTHSFEWVNEAGQVLPNAVNTTGGVHTFLTSGSNLYIGGSITEINGDAVHSFVRVVLPAAPNAAPSSLNATAQRGKVTLTWTDNSDNEAGFDVYRSEDNGASYALLGTTKDASYTDNTVAPETAYRYYVEATNLGGSSSPSNIASITSAEDVPPAPSKLVITMEAQINAKLTWQDNAKNETEYRVYRYSSSEGPSSYVLYKTLPANTTTFTDPQLIPGTSYSYYVKAFNSLGESLQTNTESATFSLPSPTWANVPDATGVERSSAAYFVIGNKGYVGTGRNASGRLKDFWEFDPATGWTKKKDFPGSARTAAVGFSINGKGYIGLGNDGSGKFKTDFYEYDPVADDWKAVAEFPADPNSEGGLSSAASFVIGNYGYVGLGNSGLSNVKTFMRFDPVANKWEPMAAFGGSGRPGAIGFAINGKGYFGLGGVDPKLSDIWEYNPVTNSWTSFFNNQISGRSGATAFVIHNRAYMGLGDAGDLFTENLQVNFRGYDFSTRNWFVMPDYTGVKRTGAIAFVINNTAYVGLGSAISGSVTNYYSDMKSFQPLSALTPEAPSALTAALEPGGTSITLNWTDQSSNETGFIIQRSVGTNSTSFMRIGTVEANTTTFTDTDLVSGTVYNYRVAALNNYGINGYSATVTQAAIFPPAAPGELSAKAVLNFSSRQIVLNWKDNSTNEEGFEVFVSEDGNEFRRLIRVIGNPTYTYSGLAADKQYFFKVRAYNLGGFSDFTPVMAIYTNPADPTNLVLSELTTTSVHLTWIDNSTSETGYAIYRSSDGSNYTLLTTTEANATSFTDNSAQKAITYRYHVKAVNSGGESYATPNVFGRLLPLPPTDFVVKLSGNDFISISWTSPQSGEETFELFRAEYDTDFFSFHTTLSPIQNPYDDFIGTYSGVYHYKMRSSHSYGHSEFTDVKTINLAVTGIDDEATSMKFYPNPVRHKLYVTLPTYSIYPYVLTDTKGNVVTKGEFTDSTGSVDMTDMKAGLYFLQVRNGSTFTIVKVVKE